MKRQDYQGFSEVPIIDSHDENMSETTSHVSPKQKHKTAKPKTNTNKHPKTNRTSKEGSLHLNQPVLNGVSNMEIVVGDPDRCHPGARCFNSERKQTSCRSRITSCFFFLEWFVFFFLVWMVLVFFCRRHRFSSTLCSLAI